MRKWVKILSGSALRSVDKLKTDILEYGAKSAYLLKPSNSKARSSSGNTSTWLRKYEIISEGDFGAYAYSYDMRSLSTLLEIFWISWSLVVSVDGA